MVSCIRVLSLVKDNINSFIYCINVKKNHKEVFVRTLEGIGTGAHAIDFVILFNIDFKKIVKMIHSYKSLNLTSFFSF